MTKKSSRLPRRTSCHLSQDTVEAELEVQTSVMVKDGSPFYLIAIPEVASKTGFKRLTGNHTLAMGTGNKPLDYGLDVRTMIVDNAGRVEEKIVEDNLEV